MFSIHDKYLNFIPKLILQQMNSILLEISILKVFPVVVGDHVGIVYDQMFISPHE